MDLMQCDTADSVKASLRDAFAMLWVSQNREVVVTTDSQPFAFEGETTVVGDVIAQEPVTDFNVLTRRSACRHTSERIAVESMEILPCSADVLIAHAQSSTGGIEIEGDVELRAGDTLIIKENVPQSLCLRGDGTLFVARILFN